MEGLKEFIESEKNAAEEFYKSCQPGDLVICVGGGWALNWYKRWLENKGIPAGYVVDNNAKEGEMRCDIPVISKESIRDQGLDKKAKFVITAPRYKKELVQEIKTWFGEGAAIYSFESEIYCTFINDVEEYREYLRSHLDDINELYDSMEDDLSRKTLENFVKGRLSGNQDYFTDVFCEDQYFTKDIIQFGEDEVLVEVGSYNGKTLQDILEFTGRNYKKIICFEPDKDCIGILEGIISKEKNIELIKKGVGSKEDKMYFYSDSMLGTGRVVSENEKWDYFIEITTLDKEIKDKCTYLKMDVEGMEMDVLRGATEMIRTCRPKLAICIYHNPSDFIEIPKLIKSLNPDYHFYLRHHNWSATETVLYAI